MSERVNVLMDYLDRLTKLNEGGYNCHKEITECVLNIRKTLDLVKVEPMVIGMDINLGKDYSSQFITREDLNGSIKRIHEFINKVDETLLKEINAIRGCR